MKRTVKFIALITILALSSLALFACNKKGSDGVDTSDYLNIYRNHTSISEFTSTKAEMTLPEGWSVYTASSKNYTSNSDSGYIKSMNAFIVTNGTVLSVMNCGSNELLFPEATAITAIKALEGLYVIKSGDGTVSVYNSAGKLKISRANIRGVGSSAITSVVNVLSSELVAVGASFDANSGGSNYTSIYRVSTGKVACRVKNQGGSIIKLDGFDNDYVVAADTTEDNKATSRIFKIPAGAPSSPVNYDGTQLGTFVDNDGTDYYIEITYMGGGRFFVHEDWSVTEKDDYTYFDGDVYKTVSRHIYNAANDTLSVYNSNHYFLNLSNKYYGSGRTGIAADGFLNDGFYYASYCMSVDENKIGLYDQFILDENLNVVLSLSGNLGINMDKVDAVDEVSYFDLAMIFTDGIGVVPVLTSIMRGYNRDGSVRFENKEHSISTAAYNNGVIIATKTVNNTTTYGAFNMDGTLIIPFNYTKIDPFTGYYTIAEKTVNNATVRVLISKDGKEISAMSDLSVPLADLAKTSGGTAIYKVGCYMTTAVRDGVTYYGIKNLDANVSNNVIMENNLVTGSVLYAPTTSPQDVFVFAKFSATDNFTVYRLV